MPSLSYQGDHKWLKYYQEKGLAYPGFICAFLSTQMIAFGNTFRQLEQAVKRKYHYYLSIATMAIPPKNVLFWSGSAGPYRGAKQCLFEGE